MIYLCLRGLSLAKPHASVVCQGASPDGSVDRCVSDSALPGFSVPCRAPRFPTVGDTASGMTKLHQSVAEGLFGSSLFDH